MAENIPNIPSGAVPPKKETGKVQPKKETVRINLPPKPSAAPTIKLPTLPPGGPPGDHAAAPAAPAPAAPLIRRARPAPQPPPRRRRVRRRRSPASGAAPVAARPAVSMLDTILAIAAAIVGLAAVGSTVYFGSFCRTCEQGLL